MQRLLSIVLLTIAVQASGQSDIKNAKNTIIQVEYISHTTLLDALDDYNPTTERELKYYNRSQLELKDFLQNHVFESFKRSTELNDVSLEPIHSLEHHGIKYSNGIPNVFLAKTGMKKAIKNGHSSDHYFNLKLNTVAEVGLMGLSNGKPSSFTPRVDVTLIIYNRHMEKINTLKYKVTAPNKVNNYGHFMDGFDKLDRQMHEPLLRLFIPLIDEAVDVVVGLI